MNPPKDICAVCFIKVLPTDKKAECDECDRWFHCTFVGLSSSEYNTRKLAANNKQVWKCNRFDCNANPDVTVSAKLNKLLDNFAQLPTKEDFSKLASGISDLKAQLNDLSCKVSDIEPRLAVAENDISDLKGEIAELKSTSLDQSTTEHIFEEFNDRLRRAKNIILYKLPESNSNNADLNKAHDLDILNKIFQSLGVSFSSFSFFRIGRSKGRAPRPLKVTLPSSDDVRSFFTTFSVDKIASIHASYSEIELSRDRTPNERKLLSKLRKELEERTKTGETDLTIKFVNGTPAIVKKPKNG